MVDKLWKKQPHYIRLVKRGSDKLPPEPTTKSLPDCGVATAHWIEYDDEHIFEIVPEVLTAIHRRDRYGSVVIEADADPTLRHAYPYDHRIFVMPLPRKVDEVFRDPTHAAGELQRALDDTASFASEIFGLFANNGHEDVDPPEQRPTLTKKQARGFLYSPLGDELATRIQLQPAYHGLVESDVIVVNSATNQVGPTTEKCLRRIDRLLDRARGESGRRGELFLCNPREVTGKHCNKLLRALQPMCEGGK